MSNFKDGDYVHNAIYGMGLVTGFDHCGACIVQFHFHHEPIHLMDSDLSKIDKPNKYSGIIINKKI